ncbi:MAG TPA: endonuclease/exonuclease/phosphatase family protein, partial [Glaciihabitans sp.]|nr:endonuclease/exonuclease/phosphatase family protein [Glaciihabitans sp.]
MPDVPLIGPVSAPELHVMTFNIRRRMMHLTRRSPDRWHNRKALLRRILRSEKPTVLGIQEAMPDQMTYVAESLPESYLSIGYGRNPDMSGERCAIFYDRDRLQLGEWSQLALSDTPDVPGSRSWGNMIPRVV